MNTWTTQANSSLACKSLHLNLSLMTKIKSAAAALKAFGPKGTRPLPGVRLIQNGRSGWTVQAFTTNSEGLNPGWYGIAHFCQASEVIEWANRF